MQTKTAVLATILLLLIFSWTASAAATPTPTASPYSGAGSDCILNSMTREQTQRFWDNTIGRAFRGDQISDSSDAKLMNSTPKEFQPNATTGAPQTTTVYPLEETARVLGLDPGEVANETGVPLGGALTYAQIEGLGKKKGIFDWLKKLGAVQGMTVPLTGPGENLQIALPNGKRIALSDLEKLQAINPAGCAMGNTDVDGQVSYIGVLGMVGSKGTSYDLTIAHQLNEKVLNSSQHLTSSDPFVSALNLGEGGANILIPSMYAKWLKAFGKINTIDMLVNIAAGAALYSQKSRVKTMGDLQNDKALLEQSAQGFMQTSQGLAIRNQQLTERIAGLEALPIRTPDQDTLLTQLRGQLADLDRAMAREADNLATSYEKRTVIDQQEKVAKKMGEYDEIFNQLTRRATSGLILGSIWLGPARFLYSINKGLIFNSNTLNETERLNYYLTIFVNKPVAEEFRTATDFLGLGSLMEIVGGFFSINAPSKAFFAGNYMIINNGGTETALAGEEQTTGSTTSFSGNSNNWQIVTRWTGPSDLTVFEKIPFTEENYTSLAIETNLLPPNAIIKERDRQKFLAIGAAYSIPFLAVGKLSQLPGKVYTLVPMLLINDVVMNLDHKQFSKVKCSEETVDNYIYAYTAVVGLSNLMNAIPAQAAFRTLRNAIRYNVMPRAQAAATTLNVIPVPVFMSYSSSVVLGMIDKLMLPQVMQMAISSRAEEYVSSCYDDKYQVLSYQQLPSSTKSGLGAMLSQTTKNPIGNVSQSLNLVNVLQNMGNKVTEAERYEVLNVRAQMRDQQGIVMPTELYYLHFDASNVRWWGNFESKCFRECANSANYTVCVDGEKGVYACDKKTGECETIADADRARRQQTAYDLARIIIPDRLIQSTLACGSTKVMQADAAATLSITDITCPSMQCILANLQEITGRPANPADLTSIMGKIQKIHTTEGDVNFGTPGSAGINSIRFVRLAPKTTGSGSTGLLSSLFGTSNTTIPAGYETLYPSAAAYGNSSYPHAVLAASTVNIYGDGQVTTAGASATGLAEENIGSLLTIQTERGSIDFNPNTGQLTVTLHKLAEIPIEAIKGIQTSLACNEIRIDKVIPRAGLGDEAAAEFNAALEKIQAECGMAVLETADKTYYFHKDDAGNDVIDICDKKTGVCTRYNRTGPARMEGDQMIFPTDKGDLAFRIFQDPTTGRPMLQVTYPNGTMDLSELIAARGQNGAIFFDPRTGTWYAYNGQDIPLNPDFAKKGASFYQTPQGLVGQPTDNLAGYQQRTQPTTSSKDLLSLLGLPTWPNPAKEAYAFAAMIATMLGAILLVRLRKNTG